MPNAIALIKRIANLAVPMLGSRLFNMLGSFFGMIMVAHLGHAQLAASALVGSAQITPFVILMAILFSIGVVISQNYGAKNYAQIGAIMQQGCVLGLLLSVFLAFIYHYMGQFLLLVGQQPMLVAYLISYFHWLAAYAPIAILTVCLSQFFYGVLRQRVTLISNIIGFVVYLPTAYGFVFGIAGLPKMGIAGLAIAMIVQSLVQLIYMSSVLYCDDYYQRFNLFAKHNHRGSKHVLQLFQIGWPMCIQFGGELLGWFVVSIMVGWLGERNLAAFQVVQQFMVLVFVSIFSIAEAGSILVGHEIGAKAYELLQQVGLFTLIFSGVILFFVMLLFIFIPKTLASLYMNLNTADAIQTLPLIIKLFLLNAFVLFFDAQRNVLSGLLRGLFDTRYAMMIGVVSIWLFTLPLGYCLAFYAKLQVLGFAVAYVFAFSSSCWLLWRYWNRKLSSYKQLSCPR